MKTILYLLKLYLKYLGIKIWIILLFSLIIALLDGIGISMLIPLLESVNVGQNSDKSNFLLSVIYFFGLNSSLTEVLLFIFLIFLIKSVVRFFLGSAQAYFNKILAVRLKTQMYGDILDVSYSYYTKHNTGYFVTLINEHLNVMIHSFAIFVNFIIAFIMSLTYLFLATTLSWKIAIISASMGSVMIGLMTYIVRYIRKISRMSAKISNQNTQIAVQAIYAFKYIVSTFSYKPIKQNFRNSINEQASLGYKAGVTQSLQRSLQELSLISLLILLITVEVVWLNRPLESVLVILLIFYRAINQLLSIQNNYQSLILKIGNIEMVDREMQNLVLNKVKNGHLPLEEPINSSTVVFDNVSHSYGKLNVLTNISFELLPNKITALVGPSGGGKSTIVDILTGLIIPKNGAVLINGVSLEKLNLQQWRSKIGYVNQDVMLFDDSIWNNVCMYDPNAVEEDIVAACEQANIWGFIKNTSEGLKMNIGDRGVRLSGGQRQRISIARELYKKPELLILDEATSALDFESEQIISESIDKLKGLMTVVIIAHRLTTISRADVILNLHKGKVIKHSSYDEFINYKVLN